MQPNFSRNDLVEITNFFNEMMDEHTNFGDYFYKYIMNNSKKLDNLFYQTHRQNLGYLFLQSLIKVMDCMLKGEDWRPFMRHIAQIHARFGLVDDDVDIMHKAFAEAMRHFRGVYPKYNNITLPLLSKFMRDLLDVFKEEIKIHKH